MLAPSYQRSDGARRDAGVAIRRFVNEEIARIATSHAEEGVFEFLCECGDLSCGLVVDLTLAEFRTIAPGCVSAHPEGAQQPEQARAFPGPEPAVR